MKIGQRVSQLAVIVAALFFAAAAWGIQATTTYQGKITDDSGSPINNVSANMFFRLWNDPDDQSASVSMLWEEKHLGVVVEDGIFSLTLGETVPLPFGSDVAGNDLWLEIEYEGEIMTPRLALSSVAGALYAEKAGDADTVGGIAADTIILDADLTSHAGNASAHHPKTTSFTELTDTVADEQIPAAITRDSELLDHTDRNSSAHHVRYSNTEAVAAMGSKADENALNHDKYTDSEAVAAIKDVDGSGSTLDADLLDGQHANEIIDAAADEVRTPISTCGQDINQSGSYYLTNNLNCYGTGHGISVTSDNVTIDLMGFTISADIVYYTVYGVYLNNSSNVEVKNGTVRNFNRGIYASSTTYSSIRLINVRVEDNTDSGIALYSTSNLVKGCTAVGNGGVGITVGSGSTVTNNTVHQNVSNGISTYGGATVAHNAVYDNNGTGISADSGSTVTNNTVYNNDLGGISTVNGCTVANNTAYLNGGNGIVTSSGSVVINNTSYDNAGVGITASSGVKVTGNSVRFNDSWGIYTSGGCLVTGNSVSYNNQLRDIGLGGLRVYTDTIVKENIFDNNYENNVVVINSDNVIEE